LLARGLMKITEFMTRDVQCCNASDSCARAAQLMWDHDIGACPIVDDRGGIVGMITDRDICMAAYTRGQPIGEIIVGDVMSANVVTCYEHQSDKDLAKLMSTGQIRRVPVVDRDRRPVGIVSLNDLALAMRRGRQVPAQEVAETLAAVCEPRHTGQYATA
jgi:CBS domain-containing protein